MFSFFLPMIPPTVTLQEQRTGVRNGKPYRYDPAELKDARAKFMDFLRHHKHQIPGWDYLFPLEGPVRLVTKWIWPRGEAHQEGEWKTTKPDTDNALKLFKDCLTRTGWWGDDVQVCSEVTEKFWGSRPGIYVRIEPLGPYDDYE